MTVVSVSPFTEPSGLPRECARIVDRYYNRITRLDRFLFTAIPLKGPHRTLLDRTEASFQREIKPPETSYSVRRHRLYQSDLTNYSD